MAEAAPKEGKGPSEQKKYKTVGVGNFDALEQLKTEQPGAPPQEATVIPLDQAKTSSVEEVKTSHEEQARIMAQELEKGLREEGLTLGPESKMPAAAAKPNGSLGTTPDGRRIVWRRGMPRDSKVEPRESRLEAAQPVQSSGLEMRNLEREEEKWKQGPEVSEDLIEERTRAKQVKRNIKSQKREEYLAQKGITPTSQVTSEFEKPPTPETDSARVRELLTQMNGTELRRYNDLVREKIAEEKKNTDPINVPFLKIAQGILAEKRPPSSVEAKENTAPQTSEQQIIFWSMSAPVKAEGYEEALRAQLHTPSPTGLSAKPYDEMTSREQDQFNARETTQTASQVVEAAAADAPRRYAEALVRVQKEILERKGVKVEAGAMSKAIAETKAEKAKAIANVPQKHQSYLNRLGSYMGSGLRKIAFWGALFGALLAIQANENNKEEILFNPNVEATQGFIPHVDEFTPANPAEAQGFTPHVDAFTPASAEGAQKFERPAPDVFGQPNPQEATTFSSPTSPDAKPAAEAPNFSFYSAPGVPGNVIGVERHIFDDAYTVTEGRPWVENILRDKIKEWDTTKNLSEEVREQAVQKLVASMRELDPQKLTELGFKTGNIDQIYPGDTLNLSPLNKMLQDMGYTTAIGYNVSTQGYGNS